MVMICIRDSREMQEHETLCIQLGSENFRGVLEKRIKQNTLQHIYHYRAIFLTKTVTSADYQYSNSDSAIPSLLPKIIPHHMVAQCSSILFYRFINFKVQPWRWMSVT